MKLVDGKRPSESPDMLIVQSKTGSVLSVVCLATGKFFRSLYTKESFKKWIFNNDILPNFSVDMKIRVKIKNELLLVDILFY